MTCVQKCVFTSGGIGYIRAGDVASIESSEPFWSCLAIMFSSSSQSTFTSDSLKIIVNSSLRQIGRCKGNGRPSAFCANTAELIRGYSALPKLDLMDIYV